MSPSKTTPLAPPSSRFWVRVKTRARQSSVLGENQGIIEIALTALPVKGAANEELVTTLSCFLKVQKSAVQIVSGAASRRKLIEVRGLTQVELRARLAG